MSVEIVNGDVHIIRSWQQQLKDEINEIDEKFSILKDECKTLELKCSVLNLSIYAEQSSGINDYLKNMLNEFTEEHKAKRKQLDEYVDSMRIRKQSLAGVIKGIDTYIEMRAFDK